MDGTNGKGNDKGYGEGWLTFTSSEKMLNSNNPLASAAYFGFG